MNGRITRDDLAHMITGAAASIAAATGGVASKVRARVTRAARQVFARNPDWRMRTKPRGSTCNKNRRMNSSAERVILRFLLP